MENNQIKPKKKFYKRWWFWVIVVIVIIGAIGGNGSEEDANVAKDTSSTPAATDTTKSTETKTEEPKKEEPKKEETKITYDNFLKVKMGMKYDEVIKLLGEGTQQSSSEISGIKTAIYAWDGKGMGNMNVTIQDDVVIGKAQAWLDEIYSEVSLDKYNQVKEGMTYEQAKAILGEGQITSQSKIMDMETIIYSWINKGGSNMNCTFSDNKMQMKAQINLK